jgi:amino acid adenylation domain-containing protein
MALLPLVGKEFSVTSSTMAQSTLHLSTETIQSGPQLPRDAVGTPNERAIEVVRVSVANTEGPPTRSDTASEAAPWFAAFCVLMFRYTEQDSFSVEVLSQQTAKWMGQRCDVRIQGHEPASEALLQLSELLQQPGGRYPALSREREAVGFSFVPKEGLAAAPVASVRPPDTALCRDLHLVCSAGQQGVDCCFYYDANRYTRKAVEQMSNQLCALLAALRDQPSTELRFLPLLEPVQRKQLLDEWSGPRTAPVGRAIFSEIEYHAAQRPEAVAAVLNTATITYAELNRRANQLARWLRARGVEDGSRVAVCMEPCLEFLVAMLGIFKAGATHVPLDPGYPSERLAVILADTRPAQLLTERALVEKLAPLFAHPVCVDELGPELGALPGENLDHPVSLSQVAYIVYTSGTTGKPKGVMITHANLAHYIAVARDMYGYDSRDVIPAIARYTFSITFFELLCPLSSGARLVLLERNHVLDMQRMVRTLTEATCIHCSPSLWRKIIGFIDEQGLPAESFRNMRHVSSGGDMVPPDVLESLKRVFDQAEVFVIYGCSEVSCMGCTYPVPRDRKLASTRVGKPFPNVTLRLLDATGQLLPAGVIGEVCFGGAGLASGYLDAPELTAKKFTDFEGERLYHTGDLGRVDSDGNLELVGRSDFQIKLRGIRIEPAEIEATLRAMPGVRDAIVAAPTLQDGEKRLVAYVVPNRTPAPTARELREYLKRQLPDYMVPGAYVLLDALPVNLNQKVDRLALSRLQTLPPAQGTTSDPPRTPLERKLLGVWEQVLDVKGIGIRDEFFDIGGDSLRSVVLMTAIDKELGIALPVSTLLTEPTIERLAQLIEAGDRERGNESSLVVLRRGNDQRPAVFFIHDGDGESMPYRNLAIRLHTGHTVYGVHPKSSRHHPILHTRLSEMVDYYVGQIKSVQPKGPYFVGGLCIGGFLAFEVARALEAQGDTVGPVALIDVAHVTTPPRSVAARRFNRLSSELRGGDGASLPAQLLRMATLTARRVRNVVEYEARTRYAKRLTTLKIQLLRAVLDRGAPIPAFLRNISVDSTLRFAEKEYVVPAPYRGEAVLFRATSKDPALDGLINDTPYIAIFEDPMLGWEGKSRILHTYDIPAGHSSTLREPNVRQVAEILQRHIDSVLGPGQHSENGHGSNNV